MKAATVDTRRLVPWPVTFFGAVLAAVILLFSAPATWAAEHEAASQEASEDDVGELDSEEQDAEDSETGGQDSDEQEVTDYFFGGIVRFGADPVPDVTMSISGNGFEGETETDAEGRWRLYVPEKETYTLTVDEDTLPEGVIVDPAQLPETLQPIDGTTGSFEVSFGLTNTAIVNLFLGEGERLTTGFVDQFFERLMNGLNFGLLLALASIGLSLIYGTTGLTNFAHAEMVTFGAIVAWVFGVTWAWPMWVAIPAVVVVGAIAGWALNGVLWRPLSRRNIGIVQLMIVSIGLSFAVRYIYLFFMGGTTYQLPGAGAPRIPLIGPIKLSPVDMMSMGISVVVLIAVGLWLIFTKTGKATRAISDNPQLAAASGINVERVLQTVWIMASALAALGGILWAYFRPGLRWDMGVHILLLIFAAVILGGLGTAFGALIGAIIVGVLVELSSLWIPADLKYVGALVVLIIILLLRPQGILGRKERVG